MKHPFAGIMPNEPSDNSNASAESSNPDRREALAAIAGAVIVAASPAVSSADEEPTKGAKEPTHALYFVEPTDLKKLMPKRRAELGVHGPFKGRWPEDHRLQDKRGYLAWLTKAQADQVKAADEVKDVFAFNADDVVVYGTPKGLSNQLTIYLSPNSWDAKIPAETFTSANDLAITWTKKFEQDKSLKIKADKEGKSIHITIAGGKPNPDVITAIRESGQVHQITWSTKVTTLAVGEEGGRPTTLAIGEEGGPTTKRVGEEGGPSTRRLGEEGGPSTDALGEEGGATTLALGEEGGRPKVIID